MVESEVEKVKPGGRVALGTAGIKTYYGDAGESVPTSAWYVGLHPRHFVGAHDGPWPREWEKKIGKIRPSWEP